MSPSQPDPIRFYSPQAVFMAVSLGTPVAGGILMNWNCRAFPTEAHRAWRVLLAGILGTLVVFAIDYAFENVTLHLVLCALSGIAMQRWTAAQRERVPLVALDKGGGGLAILIGACVGMACLILIVLALWGISELLEPRTYERLEFGPGREVFVHEDLETAEGRRVASALEKSGWWGSEKKGVAVVKRAGGRPEVQLIVREGDWGEAEAHRETSRLGIFLSQEVYDGKPIFVSLIDKEWKIHLRVDVPGVPQGPGR